MVKVQQSRATCVPSGAGNRNPSVRRRTVKAGEELIVYRALLEAVIMRTQKVRRIVLGPIHARTIFWGISTKRRKSNCPGRLLTVGRLGCLRGWISRSQGSV